MHDRPASLPATPGSAPAWPPPGTDLDAVARWSALLLASFRHWTGRDLLPGAADGPGAAAALWAAPFVVVSHGTEEDPVLNYGNRAALALWETDWATLTRLPSRLTAEPLERAERARMFQRVHAAGWVDDYRGVRITSTGRRFTIDDGIIWTLRDGEGRVHGHAATFSRWTWLPAPA